jgi:transposase-like protein
MRLEDSLPVEGLVEVDPSCFGGVRKGKRGRGAAGKAPVFGILKRGGRIHTVMIPDVRKDTLLPIIRQKVVPDSIVYTDSYPPTCRDLDRHGGGDRALSISGIPYLGRVSEVALREVDRGLIEAVRAMGGGNWTIIREALVPEALPSLIAGFTVTLVLLVGASAMAGAVGAGGLGDLAIRYGYQRFETSVMIAVIVVLIALVALIQAGGDWLARSVDHR